MFILRHESTNRVLLNKERSMMIVCRNRQAAESAVKSIRTVSDVPMTYDRLDRTKTVGLWSLRRRNGKPYELERGVKLAFKNRWDAWRYAGSVFHNTGSILIPTPA